MLRHYVRIIDNYEYLYIQQGDKFYKINYKHAHRIKYLYIAHLISNSYAYFYANYISFRTIYDDYDKYSKFTFELISKKEFVKGII